MSASYRSVRVRLVMTLALVVSVIILVLGVFSYHARKSELMEQYLAERENVRRSLSINLANPVWNWDLRTVELNLQAERNGVVAGISVAKNAQELPFAAIWAEEKQRFKIEEDTLTFPLYLPDNNQRRAIGFVTLVTSRHAMAVTLQNLVVQRAMELLALLALVLIAFWWTLLQVVLKPLSNLNAVLVNASKVESSDFTLALPDHTHDEFGDVLLSVEHIQHKLRADLKRAEEAQARANRLYAEQLVLIAELEKSRLLAEESSRSKGEFLANMSHEIRTPMNAVIGLSSLALRLDMSERLHDYLSKIKNSGEHLLGIINDILDFSKIESGKMAIEHVPFALDTVIDNMVNLVNEKAEHKGLKLICTVNPDIPPVLVGDALRIGQVLINLSNNAVKFTEQGEVRIRVDMQEHTGDQLTLQCEVQDTGIGLTPEQVSKLFQSFSQADASITRKYGGTGLGLTICKNLVEAMGGHIGVRSEFGNGSTFWFTVQLGVGRGMDLDWQHLPSTRSSNLEGQLGAIAGARVLLVEDNEINQLVATELLRSAGLHVEVADNGQIAVGQVQTRIADRQPYDIVLMDMQMPVMDGVTATRLIRENLSASQLPIVAMTANAMQSDRERCMEAGMNAVVTKPINPDELWRALLHWVRLRPGLGTPVQHTADSAPASSHAPDVSPSDHALLQHLHTISGLDTRQGLLRTGNAPSFYIALLRKMAHTQADAIAQIRRSVQADDMATAERTAHTLKSVAGNLGALDVQHCAGALEAALHRPTDAIQLSLLLQEAEAALHKLLTALHTSPGFVQTSLPAAEAPLDPTAVRDLLHQLMTLVQDDDAEALNLWALHRSVLVVALPVLQALDQFLPAFEFEGAQRLLRQALDSTLD